MKAIKALVVFLGILLVAGLGLLGYGLFAKKAPRSGMVAAGQVPAEFGSVPVPVSAGSRIEQMAAVGDRVVLRLSGGGPERLVVLDPAQGKVVGGFVLAPEPAVR